MPGIDHSKWIHVSYWKAVELYISSEVIKNMETETGRVQFILIITKNFNF